MKQILLLGSLIALGTSCVSLKTARTLPKAENKIIKYHTGIQNQIEVYPQLVDKAFTRIVKVPVFVKGDSAQFDTNIINVDSLVDLTNEYKAWIEAKQEIIDSLLNVPIVSYPVECDEVVQQLSFKLKTVNKLYQEQKEQTLYFLDRYNNLVFKRVEDTYEDELFLVSVIYQDGKLTITPRVKDRWIITDVEKQTYVIDIRKHFWQDIKFWGFLILLVNLFYFFNRLFYNILDSIFTAIKTFIRKVFIKI
jgi:hypothetical protein